VRALRILLVDDEPLARRRLRTYLRDIPDVEVVGEACDGHEARSLMAELGPDLVLLDIKMPGMSGVELAAAVQGPQTPMVVFVTAYARFATDAFDLAATDYLLKPVEPERLRMAVERARAAIASRDRAEEVQALQTMVARLRQDPLEPGGADGEVWVREKGDRVVVPVAALDWIEAERDYVRLHCGVKSYLLRQSISAFARRLDPQAFVQVHRSAIVRRARIERVRREASGALSLVLSTGDQVRVSRPYAKVVRTLTGARGDQPSP
jgi:DNA-binding LytR/AlgR family response regulator